MLKTFPAILLVLLPFLASAQNRAYSPRASKPFTLGRIEQIYSKVLGEERILNVYLPDGYSREDSITKYPVIYLLDGSANEDFIHIVGLVQFNSFPWINRVPKSIVVGIANVDRKRDFTSFSPIKEDQKLLPTGGHSDQFIRFLDRELIPWVDRKYNTSSSRTIIGESLGGLLAADILLTQPTSFDKYIIISPSLWWNDGSLLRKTSDVYSDQYTKKTSVYIGVGKEGLGPSVTPHVMEIDANILADKLKNSKSKSLSVYFDYLPEEVHATIGHQAVFNAFKHLYPPAKEQ